MKQLSRKRRIKQARQAIGKNWRDVMAYERFVKSCFKYCGCQPLDCPCPGVLAGGVCDSAYESEGEEARWIMP